ncbi:MAG TPA: hypothetical protein VEA38_25800, partial [Terriglobales bacterium]|nr:hypothetical protein [Terriglobales bacterium]
METTKPTTWPGGRIHYGKDGTAHYYIWKKRGGREFKFALGVSSLKVAMKELELWEQDPESYVPPRERIAEATGRVTFDHELITDFVEWSALPKAEGGKGNTKEWANQQRIWLVWWLQTLGNIDLRRLAPTKVLDVVEGAPARAHKLRVLSMFYTWLMQRKGLVKVTENPFKSGRIQLPQSEPSTETNVIPFDVFKRVLVRLANPKRRPGTRHVGNRIDHWPLALIIQAGTAWHATEVRRFAESGSIEPPPPNAEAGVVAVLVTPRHKH